MYSSATSNQWTSVYMYYVLTLVRIFCMMLSCLCGLLVENNIAALVTHNALNIIECE